MTILKNNIVSDSSPLISLYEINRIELINYAFGNIVIPTAVYEEVSNYVDTSLKNYIDESSWINVVLAKDKLNLLHNPPYGLHKGELEAIALALSDPQHIDGVLVDDSSARKYAGELGLTVLGTLGCLSKSKNLGYINKVYPIIEELKSIGFHMDDNIIETILGISGELEEYKDYLKLKEPEKQQSNSSDIEKNKGDVAETREETKDKIKNVFDSAEQCYGDLFVEISYEDFSYLTELYCDKPEEFKEWVPEIQWLSISDNDEFKYQCCDNRQGEAFQEGFKTIDKAIRWVEGESIDDIEMDDLEEDDEELCQ